MIVRVAEWSRKQTAGLSGSARQSIVDAATAWKNANRLQSDPIRFEGPDGSILTTRQYVGVVSVDEVTIEIYPKLDKSLLDEGLGEQPTDAVMNNLLWMLHIADRQEVYSADSGGLSEVPARFLDVFALLLARNLLREFQQGLCRRYIRCEDNLRAIKGRLLLQEQVTRNRDRFDRIACAWDELTYDTPLFRLVKCACRELQLHVSDPITRQLLRDCTSVLDVVLDVTIETALYTAWQVTWDRGNDRYRRSFQLARRLLQGTGHALAAGSSDTFVFLIDMNKVFEEYVEAIIGTVFATSVEKQKTLGTLLRLNASGMNQIADYYWHSAGDTWIGDAKYKNLLKGQSNSLRFLMLADTVGAGEQLAGQIVSPDDIRQLTVYAGLEQQRTGAKANLALFYPFAGAGHFDVDSAETWNGHRLILVPVQLKESPHVELLVPGGWPTNVAMHSS